MLRVLYYSSMKSWPVYIFAFGEYNSKQVNVSGIKIFRAQFLALNLRKVMLNAVNIYLFAWNYTHQMQKCIQVFCEYKV